MQDAPKIVVKRLQEMAVSDPHPEPNLLASFAEQALDRSDRNLVLDHLARCAECRQIVALAVPEVEPEAVSGSGFIRPGWLRLPALRWGFGTVAVLALISAGVLRYKQPHAPQTDLATSSSHPGPMIAGQTDVAPRQSAPVSQSPPASQEENTQASISTLKNRETSAHSQSLAAKGGLQSAANSGITSDQAKQIESPTTKIVNNLAPDQLVQKQAQAASPYDSYASSDVVKAKAAVPTQASGASAPAFSPAGIPPQTSPSLMQSDSPRWAVTAIGGLQRSFDAGRTWQDVSVITTDGQSQNKIVFRAVAAVGPEVWAGGLGAILYHSSDSGTTWQQALPSTSGTQPAGDITQIEFSNSQQGKISTSAGETWTTSDNGTTWAKQQ